MEPLKIAKGSDFKKQAHRLVILRGCTHKGQICCQINTVFIVNILHHLIHLVFNPSQFYSPCYSSHFILFCTLSSVRIEMSPVACISKNAHIFWNMGQSIDTLNFFTLNLVHFLYVDLTLKLQFQVLMC